MAKRIILSTVVLFMVQARLIITGKQALNICNMLEDLHSTYVRYIYNQF
jgi:hypothetical protein